MAQMMEENEAAVAEREKKQYDKMLYKKSKVSIYEVMKPYL